MIFPTWQLQLQQQLLLLSYARSPKSEFCELLVTAAAIVHPPTNSPVSHFIFNCTTEIILQSDIPNYFLTATKHCVPEAVSVATAASVYVGWWGTVDVRWSKQSAGLSRTSPGRLLARRTAILRTFLTLSAFIASLTSADSWTNNELSEWKVS